MLEALFFIPFLLFPLVIIFLPLKGILSAASGNIKSEMGLILGIPIMSSKSSLSHLSDQGGHYYHDEATADYYHRNNIHDHTWSYSGMERSGSSFRRSSGSTSSERASSSSGGGGFDSGGGGGGFDSGGSGGGGGRGGDF